MLFGKGLPDRIREGGGIRVWVWIWIFGDEFLLGILEIMSVVAVLPIAVSIPIRHGFGFSFKKF